MTIFDEYKTYTGDSSISPSLLWEYDLSHFDWWKSRKIVVQRVIQFIWRYRGIPGNNKRTPKLISTRHEFCLYCL